MATISARKQEPTDGVGVPSPQPRQDRVMKTTPLAGYVVIVPSAWSWGERNAYAICRKIWWGSPLVEVDVPPLRYTLRHAQMHK